jgi:hypothetical protein
MAPFSLNHGARGGAATLLPEMNPGTHCRGGWVGPTAGLDVLQKKTRWNVHRGPPNTTNNTLLLQKINNDTTVKSEVKMCTRFGVKINKV